MSIAEYEKFATLAEVIETSHLKIKGKKQIRRKYDEQ
jgi:hypothetical protein